MLTYAENEKSMVGQKIFTIVIKRLQEARPHYNDKPFLNISVVLLGDFNQQPTVCNISANVLSGLVLALQGKCRYFQLLQPIY